MAIERSFHVVKALLKLHQTTAKSDRHPLEGVEELTEGQRVKFKVYVSWLQKLDEISEPNLSHLKAPKMIHPCELTNSQSFHFPPNSLFGMPFFVERFRGSDFLLAIHPLLNFASQFAPNVLREIQSRFAMLG